MNRHEFIAAGIAARALGVQAAPALSPMVLPKERFRNSLAALRANWRNTTYE